MTTAPDKPDATASSNDNPPPPQDKPKEGGSTLTAEIDIELTHRDMINLKRSLQVVYVIRKELIVKGVVVPIVFTFRTYQKGAKAKAIRAAKRKERKRNAKHKHHHQEEVGEVVQP